MLDINDKKIEWFKKAKFGLFIHWGLYAVTEGYWNGEKDSGIVEWIAAHKRIPNSDYERLAEKMTCEKFNPDYIAALAADAGMKYCVFTAKHHDGFAMFDTKYDDYSIVKKSPYGKDVTAELTAAMRRRGIVPCLYYSQALDFHEKNAMGNTWDNDIPEEKRDFVSYINGKCKFQLKEILENYGDIGLIWMDVPKGMTAELAEDLKSYIKGIQPGCLVSGRIGGGEDMGDYGCLGDNQIPAGELKGCWETAATMNDTWGYKSFDHNFKSPKELIELLCGLVSKGANLLLNIGPDAKGEIPAESVGILKEIGKWMSINGEAVYGTEPSAFKADFSFGTACKKENILYLFVYNTAEKISLNGIESKAEKVSLLGYGELEFKQGEALEISLKNVPENEYVNVVKVAFNESVKVRSGLYSQESGKIILPAYCGEIKKRGGFERAAEILGDAATKGEKFNTYSENEISINAAGIIENWFSEKDGVSWSFYADNDGEYDAVLYTLSQKYIQWKGGHTVHFECNGVSESKTLTADFTTVGANKKYFDETGSFIGKLTVKKGKNILKLIADRINPKDLGGLCISKIILSR